MNSMVRSIQQGKDHHIFIYMHIHIQSLYEESFILQRGKLETIMVSVVMQKKEIKILYLERNKQCSKILFSNIYILLFILDIFHQIGRNQTINFAVI